MSSSLSYISSGLFKRQQSYKADNYKSKKQSLCVMAISLKNCLKQSVTPELVWGNCTFFGPFFVFLGSSFLFRLLSDEFFLFLLSQFCSDCVESAATAILLMSSVNDTTNDDTNDDDATDEDTVSKCHRSQGCHLRMSPDKVNKDVTVRTGHLLGFN